MEAGSSCRSEEVPLCGYNKSFIVAAKKGSLIIYKI